MGLGNCIHTLEFPCIQCEAPTPSSSSIPFIPQSSSLSSSLSSSSSSQSSSITPIIADISPFCGNSALDPGEACDDGPLNSLEPNALCRPDCQRGRCGDGILDTPLELCDDGNTLPGDGCSQQCQIERTAPQDLPATIIELPLNPIPITSVPLDTPTPPTTTDTGPAAVAIMAAGAAAGYAWVRRRRSKS
jgi:MYXO-CTERM domain-containing protein